MTSPDKNVLLADEILRILSNGVTLSNNVVNYINSTFSNPTIAELEDILQDDSNCEKDSLIELLFFPEKSLQHQLEGILESRRYEEDDEKKVVHHFCRTPVVVDFHHPENKGSFKLEIPETVTHQFIKRLNICKQIDQNLLSTIKESTSARDKIRFAVKLRNSRFAMTENALWFLSAFFEKWDTDKQDAFKYFDFILLFLEELPENTDIFKALMKKKRFYLKHLKRSQKFEEQLLKTNIETLMLSGKIAAHMDKNEAREKMEIIDRISQAVFGKSEYPELMSEDADSISLRSDQGIVKI